MTDDFVQAGLFVAIGATMVTVGSIMLKRMIGLGAKIEATTAFFVLIIACGLVLSVVGLGILSLMWSTDL